MACMLPWDDLISGGVQEKGRYGTEGRGEWAQWGWVDSRTK